MKYNIEISKILDNHLPANGVGTERELLRMNIHRDMTDLINKLILSSVVVTCCEPIPKDSFYLGMTCPKCKKPFRQNLK
jgi:hypothetical protein